MTACGTRAAWLRETAAKPERSQVDAFPATHRLSDADLAVLTSGKFPAEIICKLQAAELSKSTLLIESLRRNWRRTGAGSSGELLRKAAAVLGAVQEHAPDVAADVLALPHVGLWAADCLSRIRSGSRGQHDQQLPSYYDLGQLATFASVSALRIGYPFKLVLPVHCGSLSLPSIGTARLGRADNCRWAVVTHDQRGVVIRSARRTVRLPSKPPDRSGGADSAWRPATWLTAELDGLRLKAMVETSELFLRQLSLGTAPHSHALQAAWRSQLAAAWRLLVRYDRPVAAGIAAIVKAVVPLHQPAPGRLISGTSGWAWGAIAVSLAPDVTTMAETLTHEFHHLVLAGAEDITPLVRETDKHLYYAPWRDDPRPAGALLQGSYAHFGVTGFWARMCKMRPGLIDPLRSEVEFTRTYAATQLATQALIRANALTATGRALADGMLRALAAQLHQPVPDTATALAGELAAEHNIRWRLAHLRPSAAAVDAMSREYLAGRARTVPLARADADIVPGHFLAGQGLSGLLEARYRAEAEQWPSSYGGQAGSADLALLRGDYAQAAEEYKQRILSDSDRHAWVGLLLAHRRLHGNDGIARRQPEVLVALYDRIRSLTGTPPPIGSLIAWLSTGPETPPHS